MGEQIRVAVDRGKCDGHARCFALEPEIYTLDDEGFCAIEEVVLDASMAEAARKGALACPEQAITVEDVPDSQGGAA